MGKTQGKQTEGSPEKVPGKKGKVPAKGTKVPRKGETVYDFAPRNEGDWKSLKLGFFASESQNLTDYVCDLYGQELGRKWAGGGNFLRKTKGWSTERQEYLDRIEKEALEKAKKKAVAASEIDLTDLLKTKKATIELAKMAVAHYQNAAFKTDKKTGKKILVSAPPMKDVERVHKMIRTELGETTGKVDVTSGGQPISPFGAINVIISDDVKKSE